MNSPLVNPNIFIKLYEELHNTIKNDILNESRSIREYDIVLKTINTKNYIDNLLSSYDSKEENIWHQFDLDCDRTNIIIEGNRFDNQTDFKLYMNKFGMDDYYYDDLNMTCILGLLCNQSSYTLSYTECHNLFADPYNEIYVFNSSTNRFIKIIIGDNKINIQIIANFKLMDISKIIILGYIETCITIEAIYNSHEIHFLNGFLEWNFCDKSC